MPQNISNGRTTNNKGKMLKVVLLGDGGVGKSSLMNRFVSNEFDSKSFHTIGVEFLNKDVTVNNVTYTLQIWDTAGQERFKSLRTPFYRGADCCLLTFGLDDLKSFRNLQMWKTEFLYYADIQDPDNFPFVVLGNKVDVATKHVTTDEARDWCKHSGHAVPYYETSAKDAINVDAAFTEAVKQVTLMESRFDLRNHSSARTVDLSSRGGRKQQNGGCC